VDRGTGNHPEYVRPQDGDDDLNAVIANAVKDAIAYVEDELSPERVRATEYYHGKLFGNEVEGRSKVVMTEVRDGITGILPGLIRLLHGPEHVVEYVPKRGDQVEQAEQATDYARFVFEEDNQGLLVTHSVLKDGLLKKIGIVKWGMDETEEKHVTKYDYLTREELMLLSAEEGAEFTAMQEMGPEHWSVEVTRTVPTGKLWVRAVPPDDFFWNREARSLEEAILVGHRERLTRSELRGIGVSDEDIDEYGGQSTEGTPTTEETARRQQVGSSEDPEMGEENRRYLYCEVYMYIKGERRKVCTLGESYFAIKNVPCGALPFAVFSPDPEPHAMLGGSWYDRLKDVQYINSGLFRGFFDSLGVSLFPRPIYVDGQASVADIMNNAIGAPIRERQPNMVRFDQMPFTGEKVLPALSMMREVVERRTGSKDGAMSLDMDSLQSTGKQAVEAAITAAQSVSELIARFYAEQVMKPLFKGLLPLIAHPKSQARIIRLRGKYVPMNPAAWDANMDVSVNVALGSMNVEKKVMLLEKVAADQSAILQEMGLQNPAVSLHMLFNTKSKVLRLSGIQDVENYYMPVAPDWQPPPPPPPEPTPDELWIQAEKEMAFQKSMKELAIKQDELELQRQKLAVDSRLKEQELAIRENEHAHGLREEADVQKYKADLDAQMKMEQLASTERIERERLDMEREKLRVEIEKMQMEMEIAKLNAETQVRAAETTAKQSKEKEDKSEKAEKPEPVVINVMPAAAPNVNVEAPVVQMPEPKKRKGTLTGPDGKKYTMESD
jgi:hypothetical protein